MRLIVKTLFACEHCRKSKTASKLSFKERMESDEGCLEMLSQLFKSCLEKESLTREHILLQEERRQYKEH